MDCMLHLVRIRLLGSILYADVLPNGNHFEEFTIGIDPRRETVFSCELPRRHPYVEAAFERLLEIFWEYGFDYPDAAFCKVYED